MWFHSTVDCGITLNRFSQDLQLIDMELPGAALGVTLGSFSIEPTPYAWVAKLVLLTPVR